MGKRYDTLLPALKRLLPEDRLDTLGRVVAFIRRLRALQASTFVWSVVLSRFGHGKPGFEQARQWYERLAGSTLWPRPFQMRFKSRAAVRLFERAFEAAVQPWRQRLRVAHPLAKKFSDVVAVDTTWLQASDALEGVFKGFRTAKASLKVALSVSVFGGIPLYAAVFEGTPHDSRLFPPLEIFRRGTLLLFDKGFSSYDQLQAISDAGLHYLCPMNRVGNALVVGARRAPKYVRNALRRNPKGVWLRELLPTNKRIGKTWDLDVRVRDRTNSTPKIRTRLVIVPGTIRPQRPYLTNVTPEDCSPAALEELYRLRWQIELVIKELKQDLNLCTLPSKDPNAVKVFIWASLIALAVSRTVFAVICPMGNAVGLRSRCRRSLTTRALRSAVHLIGRALVDRTGKALSYVGLLLDQLLLEVRARAPGREDSFQRLQALLL